jgi:hypothetical protein
VIIRHLQQSCTGAGKSDQGAVVAERAFIGFSITVLIGWYGWALAYRHDDVTNWRERRRDNSHTLMGRDCAYRRFCAVGPVPYRTFHAGHDTLSDEVVSSALDLRGLVLS